MAALGLLAPLAEAVGIGGGAAAAGEAGTAAGLGAGLLRRAVPSLMGSALGNGLTGGGGGGNAGPESGAVPEERPFEAIASRTSNLGCEDCGHSFYYPGQNTPLLVEGGCPECGGNVRPEPDQPSPTHGDGGLRDMAGPGYESDQGGNPLQEGVIGQTDGGFAPRMKRDESFASVKQQFSATSNQDVQMPWDFEVEEVAPPGIPNEEAEEIMDGTKRAALDEDDDKGTDTSDDRPPTGEGEDDDADPKQKDDGDNKDFQKDVSVDEGGGGSITGQEPGAHDLELSVNPDAMTPGLQSLQMMLPLVVHYAESPEAGSEHPIIQALADLLTSEGHMDAPHDHGAAAELIQHHRKSSWLPWGGLSGPAPGAPQQVPQPQGSNPFSPTNCAMCGGTVEPGKACAQCGYADAGQGQVMAGTQGPHNPEQIAAVQQLLIDQGRVDEVPNVLLAPEQYADEMGEVANRVDTPPQDITRQPQPTQEDAPPGDTMPVPGMSIPQGQGAAGVMAGYATSNIGFGQCQNCMGPLQQDGSCAGCERSPAAGAAVPAPGYPAAGAPQGNQNAATPMNPAMQQFAPANVSRPPSVASWRVTGHGDDGAQEGVDAADQEHQRDVSEEQDSSHQWQTEDGTPVQDGQQYELHTPGVEIPDIVTVQRILPDSIELAFTGEFQMGFTKNISREEWDTMGYTLTDPRADTAAQPELDSQGPVGRPEDEPATGVQNGGMSNMDPGHNFNLMARHHAAEGDGYESEWGGPGESYNDKTQKPGTKPIYVEVPYRNAFTGQNDVYRGPVMAINKYQKRGQMVHELVINPMTVMQMREGDYKVIPTDDLHGTPEVGPDQPEHFSSIPTVDAETGQPLSRERQAAVQHLLTRAAVDPAPGEEVPEADLRTAGAHFPPSAQRELIDEEGAARNADKLDLSNTHYESRAPLKTVVDADSFLW
ncbi:hypothetical protein [Candidatus Solirubrobacter pratensis]|uniref:hypothetical protein n=1 Tax=Candidatus Solirubrobacter pratensis TaxID=1298857 RepID=UPI00040E80F3|nr:hypothetical protein [Candidatus Solirubrobacter pratensis]